MKTKDIILFSITVIVTLLLSFGIKRGFSSSSLLYNEHQRSQFEMTDFYNSVGKYVTWNRKSYSNDVVIVGIDGCRVEKIPDVIDAIESYSPKVIGVDILFGRHSDSVDKNIVTAIKSCRQSVVVAHINANDQLERSPIFQDEDITTAVDNLQEPVVRKYWPQFIVGDTLNSFAMELLKYYSPDKYSKQLERRNEMEHIHIYDFRCETIGWEQFFEEDNTLGGIIKDKIVIIGSSNNEYDEHYTTMDKTMSGAVIHAAIINTILNEDYTNECHWLHYLLAIMVTAGFIWLMITLRKKYSAMGNLLIRILQVVFLIIFVFVGAKLYIDGHLYLNLSVTLLSVGLAFIGYDIVFGLNEMINRIIGRIKSK